MLYRPLEACQIAGISYRQLDYWVRVGAVQIYHAPTGSGSRRVLSSYDVWRLCTVSRAMNDGGPPSVHPSVGHSVDVVRTIWQAFDHHEIEPGSILFLRGAELVKVVKPNRLHTDVVLSEIEGAGRWVQVPKGPDFEILDKQARSVI